MKLADFLREKIKVSKKYLILMGDLKYTTHTFAEWHEHFMTRYPKSTLETSQMNFPSCRDLERTRFENTLEAGNLTVTWKPEKPKYISWRGGIKDPMYRVMQA